MATPPPIAHDPETLSLLNALASTGAPRFLLSLLEAPPGDYRIEVDNETLDRGDRHGELAVWIEDGERRASLHYAHRFAEALARGVALDPVHSFLEVQNATLYVSHSTDEIPPEVRSAIYPLADLANDTSIEDFCELNSLPMVDAKSGTKPPTPVAEGEEYTDV